MGDTRDVRVYSGEIMRICSLTCLVLLLVMTSSGVPRAATGQRSWVEHVAGAQSSFLGRVVNVEPMKRVPISSACGSGLGPYHAWRAQIEVLDRLRGVITDSLVSVQVASMRSYGRRDVEVGDSLVFTGRRICEDAWNLWGSAVLLFEGRLRWSNDGSPLTALPGSEIELEKLSWEEAKLEIDKVLRASPDVASGKPLAAIVLARVSKVALRLPSVILELDSARVVAGRSDELPTRLVVATPDLCQMSGSPMVGEQIWIPVTAARAAGAAPLRIELCPSELLVRNGYVSTLGVAADSIGLALEPAGEGTFAIRKWRSRISSSLGARQH